MKMRNRASINFFAFLVLTANTFSVIASDNGREVTDIIATGTEAIPIKHEPPTYPKKALFNGVEGWVVLSFIIREDGTTDDIIVLDASIENYFEKAAISAVKAWVYTPATRNGEAVIQYNRRVRTVFSINADDDKSVRSLFNIGVTKSFLAKYKDANKAIDDGDMEEAKSLIAKLDSYKKRLLTEVYYLDVLKASYYQRKHDSEATLKYLERVLVIANEVATKERYIGLLKQAVVENARAGNYRAALQHYNTLLEVDQTQIADDQLRNLVEYINQTIDGDSELISKGKISQCDDCDSRSANWWHALVRNRFTIDQLDGEVNELKVLCGNHSVSFTYKPDFEWSVDNGWGECDLMVSGNNGTTFRLIELPKVESE